MKPPVNLKHFGALAVFICTFSAVNAQLIGKWQLVDETTCVEEGVAGDDSLADEMRQMSSPSPRTIEFREKGVGEESVRIFNRKKSASGKNFLYKFSGESLLILDKRSQTLTAAYTVDKLTADSLIISNSSRGCETKIFLKISGGR